jgi:hypothetical protein
LLVAVGGVRLKEMVILLGVVQVVVVVVVCAAQLPLLAVAAHLNLPFL